MKKLVLVILFPLLLANRAWANCEIRMTETANNNCKHIFTNLVLSACTVIDECSRGHLILYSNSTSQEDYNQIVSLSNQILNTMAGEGVIQDKADESDENGIVHQNIYVTYFKYPPETIDVTCTNY